VSKLKRVVREIHERSLWQALVVYLGASFAVLEALDMLIDYLGLPRWFWPIAFVFLLVGLPFVVGSSLAQEEEYGEEVPADAVAAAAEEDHRLRVLTWRNGGAAFVGALAIWGAVAGGWLLMGGRIERPTEAAAIDPTHRIAVLPFSYRGSEEHAYLGEGMVDLLSYSLDGVGEVQTVTPRAVFGVLRQYEGEGADPDLGATLSQHVHAARYVEGEIVESRGRLWITARLVPVETEPGDAVAAVLDGEIDDGIPQLIDALSGQLLVGVVGREAAELSELGRVASMTTDSLAALKAFLQGLRSLRAHELDLAREQLKRAVEIDSTFALAWRQLAEAVMWNVYSPELCLEAADRAVRWSEHLPWRERQLIVAFDAFIRGDFDAAERQYRAVTGRYPENVAAWVGLADVLFYHGRMHGRGDRLERLELYRQAYLRSAEYEPELRYDLTFSYWWVAVAVGDSALADSLLPQWTSREKQPYYTRVFEAFCVGDRATQDTVVARGLSSGETHDAWVAAFHAATCETGMWRGAEIARATARQAESARVRALAHLSAANYELALGRRERARAGFKAARAIEPTWTSQHETYWSLPAMLGARRDELEAARDSLLAREAPIGSPLPPPEGRYFRWLTTFNDNIQPHIRLYLLGRLSARLGEYDAALRYADDVEALKAPLFQSSVSRDKAQAIRAFVLREQGRYPEALAALEAAPRTVNFFDESPYAREPQERFLRAELLAELGRHDEALRWLRTVGGVYEVPLLAPAHLLAAQIHERLDAADSAAVHYKRFIDLWRDCDPELRPQVEAAERALERLTAEGGTH
jgi:tetratricopeptide (TPR) repeat protein/TolB-like protein